MQTLTHYLNGEQVAPRYMDALWCRMLKARVRFVRWVSSEMVEVADENGKVMPDWWFRDQLVCMAGR